MAPDGSRASRTPMPVARSPQAARIGGRRAPPPKYCSGPGSANRAACAASPSAVGDAHEPRRAAPGRAAARSSGRCGTAASPEREPRAVQPLRGGAGTGGDRDPPHAGRTVGASRHALLPLRPPGPGGGPGESVPGRPHGVDPDAGAGVGDAERRRGSGVPASGWGRSELGSISGSADRYRRRYPGRLIPTGVDIRAG